MNQKKISIIIPCYNVEKYLPKCLDSIVNQTYKNLEIICVVDGSPDNSLIVCKNYEQKDSRIIVIDQKNMGASASRNNGLKIASGELIMFVDADDWIELDTCEKALNSMNNNNSDVVIWSYAREFVNNSKPKNIFDCDSKSFDEIETKNVYRRLFGLYEEELSNPENADSIVTIWGKLYKRKVVDGIRFVDSSILATAEDLLFNVYAFSNVKTVSYINENLNHYRKDNEGSITSNYKSSLYNQWEYLFDCMQKEIDDKSLTNDFQVALNNRIALGIIGLGLTELDNPKGVFAQIKRIKEIISSPRYRKAYKELTLKYFPIHWRVFFALAKYNCSIGLYFMLLAIKKLIGK